MITDLRNQLLLNQGGSNMELYCDASFNLIQFIFNGIIYNIQQYEKWNNCYIITIQNNDKYIIPNSLTLRKYI
jgi:hypothetical protein